MNAYTMRGQFAFLGIPAPERRKLSGEFMKTAGKNQADLSFVFECWQRPEREYQCLTAD